MPSRSKKIERVVDARSAARGRRFLLLPEEIAEVVVAAGRRPFTVGIVAAPSPPRSASSSSTSAPSERRAIISSIFGPASSPVACWNRSRKRIICFGSFSAASSIPSISAASDSIAPAIRSSSSPASGSSPSNSPPPSAPSPARFEMLANREGFRGSSGLPHRGQARLGGGIDLRREEAEDRVAGLAIELVNRHVVFLPQSGTIDRLEEEGSVRLTNRMCGPTLLALAVLCGVAASASGSAPASRIRRSAFATFSSGSGPGGCGRARSSRRTPACTTTTTGCRRLPRRDFVRREAETRVFLDELRAIDRAALSGRPTP